MIIDTHCHLDDECFNDDFEEVLTRAKINGIKKIIIPGADILDLPRAIEISEKYECVYFAVGVHPYHCDGFDINVLKKFVTHDKCVAVGECGLDYYRIKDEFLKESDHDYGEFVTNYKNRQKEIFISQINLAIEFNKPLIVHVRDANEDSYDILKKNSANLRGVLHCFNSSSLLLNLKDNFYFGIGGVLTFKNAKSLVSIIKDIPLDRILIETDAPYLSPEPNRGKRNEPSFTKFVALKMSEILDISYDKLQDITTNNANRLFFLKEEK